MSPPTDSHPPPRFSNIVHDMYQSQQPPPTFHQDPVQSQFATASFPTSIPLASHSRFDRLPPPQPLYPHSSLQQNLSQPSISLDHPPSTSHDAPTPKPSTFLTPYELKHLIEPHIDFLGPLQRNPSLRNFFLSPITTPVHPNAFSRGFRNLQLCNSTLCHNPLQTSLPAIIHSTSTLFTPTASTAGLETGVCVTAPTPSAGEHPFTIGRYAHDELRRELVMMGKIDDAGIAWWSRLITLNEGLILRDDVVLGVSGGWERCVVHARTMTLRKLIQTVQDEALEQAGGADRWFAGAGGYGLYDLLVVPASMLRRQKVGLAFGSWTLGSHIEVCSKFQLLQMSVNEEDVPLLRTMTHRGEDCIDLGDRIVGSREAMFRGVTRAPDSNRDPHNDPVVYDDKLPVPNYSSAFTSSLGGLSTTAQGSAMPYHPVTQVDSNVMPPSATNETEYPTDASAKGQPLAISSGLTIAANLQMPSSIALSSSLPLPSNLSVGTPSNNIVLPVQRSLAISATQAFHHGVQEPIQPMPSTLASNIDDVTPVHVGTPARERPSQPALQPVKIATPFPCAPVSPVRGSVSTGHTGLRAVTTSPTPPASTSPLVRKTLPAPTKSEIVIRNRISAQRSNEKRRRKIEKTKNDLQYLKEYLLPRLQSKKSSLVLENQTLNTCFQQKYGDFKIESFF